MATSITRYTATATGGSTFYWYAKPDNTSKATRIYKGTKVVLPADYASRVTNTMYPITSPGKGWMYFYNLTGITPEYKTTTDACSPPEKLEISGNVLTITGGAGGDLNALTGFGVSWRLREIGTEAWGAWGEDLVTDHRTVEVMAESGYERQYRVRTMGTAGQQYYSKYVVCSDLVSGNVPAGVPVILRPQDGAATGVARPAIWVRCPAEPDGDNMTLQRSLDDGEWTDVAQIAPEGGEVYDPLTVDVGQHTVTYRLKDANGETGGTASVTFVREARTWNREINTGDIISSESVSFADDIREMVQRINETCDFYALSRLELPGTIGLFEDWLEQLLAMREAMNRCRAAVGLPEYAYQTTSAWPSAREINWLRELIDET